MDGSMKWFDGKKIKEQQKFKQSLERLEAARNTLTPIIDNIIMSTFNLLQKDDKKFKECTLTSEQAHHVVWASEILREIKYDFKENDKKYKLPNVDVIVNNVSVSNNRMMSANDKSIVIDEATVLELLELYENMGVVIQRMMTESTRPSDEPMPKSMERIAPSKSNSSQPSFLKSPSSSKHVTTTSSGETIVQERDDTDDTTTREDSDMMNSSADLQRKRSKQKSSDLKAPNEDNDEPTIFIKIQCFSDWSEADKEASDGTIPCAKDCTSHYHLRLGGEPVTMKMNQGTAEDGTVYCINTGGDGPENEIRIIIRQCPECMATVIGSSSRIKDVLGDSHESITLHGKGGDENDMAFSSSDNELRDDELCRCLEKGRVCTDISKVRCEERRKPCSCESDLSRLISKHKQVDEDSDSQPKMDVIIDTDNVDRSTVKFHDLPLTRRRICSSMEFDITTVHTRLRDHEIEHGNAHIVVELKKLGVDQILRACRPAKCCRKAILNERQRTALPYAVSLQSLPLMGNDAEVIKQSIDMSVKKIKNATDLTQAYKDKMAFYVSLGRDDFRPNINFPWVVPVYDMKLDQTKKNDKFFVLKKKTITIPKQVRSAARLMEILKKGRKESQLIKTKSKFACRKKYFILTKKHIQIDESKVEATKSKQKSREKLVRFKHDESTDISGYMKFLKCRHTRSIYKRKNIWSNFGHDDWRLIFSQEKQLNVTSVEVQCDQELAPKQCLSRATSNMSVHYQKLTESSPKQNVATTCDLLAEAYQTAASGDYPFPSLTKMLDIYLERFWEHNKTQLSQKFSTTDICRSNKLISPKSLPAFCKHVSEELFYTSNALTVFVKRTRSLELEFNKRDIPRITKLKEEHWMCASPKFLDDIDEEMQSPKKQLEYYVGLVNGDLVWSNTLPLVPQNYDTYYNYSDHNSKTPPGTPVEERVHATRATPEESRRSRRNSHERTPSREDSIISEITEEHVAKHESKPQKPAARPLPPEFASFSMGPESDNEPWAPHTISEISLPRIREEVQKEEVQTVEAVPVERPRKETECSKKATCVRNQCKNCKSKSCDRKKKCHTKDIKITVQKTKDEGKKSPTPCNKEICELYKNKNLVPSKSGTVSKGKEKTFTISAKDNIEIYINNQKICLGNNKKSPKECRRSPQDCRKSPKEDRNSPKEDRKSPKEDKKLSIEEEKSSKYDKKMPKEDRELAIEEKKSSKNKKLTIDDKKSSKEGKEDW